MSVAHELTRGQVRKVAKEALIWIFEKSFEGFNFGWLNMDLLKYTGSDPDMKALFDWGTQNFAAGAHLQKGDLDDLVSLLMRNLGPEYEEFVSHCANSSSRFLKKFAIVCGECEVLGLLDSDKFIRGISARRLRK